MSSIPTRSIHVVAGVLRDATGRILLAERPPDKHLGGLWEFPGGKREPGETSLEALKRELREEIGVEAKQVTPLIRVPWRYPDKHILLEVFCVESYDGVVEPREGQTLSWHALHQLNSVNMPAADRPVIHALRLPSSYTITPEPGPDTKAFFEALQRALERGERLIQLRAKALPHETLRVVAQEAANYCHRNGAEILLNANIELAQELNLDGVHLTSAQLRFLRQRPLPENKWVAASCHNLEELELALQLNVDFVVLAPVLATESHQESTPLGWDKFAELSNKSHVPVYALGGIKRSDLDLAKKYGAHGVAGIGDFW